MIYYVRFIRQQNRFNIFLTLKTFSIGQQNCGKSLCVLYHPLVLHEKLLAA